MCRRDSKRGLVRLPCTNLLQYGRAVESEVGLVTDDGVNDDLVANDEHSTVQQQSRSDATGRRDEFTGTLCAPVKQARHVRHVRATCQSTPAIDQSIDQNTFM